MKVILNQDVKGQGKKGQLVEVSDGYARNFLLPRKLAVEANADNVNKMRLEESAKKAREAAERPRPRPSPSSLLELHRVKIYARVRLRRARSSAPSPPRDRRVPQGPIRPGCGQEAKSSKRNPSSRLRHLATSKSQARLARWPAIFASVVAEEKCKRYEGSPPKSGRCRAGLAPTSRR
ncbi:MAG: 50S ribosomal protein L9 [Intestinimonas sp.]